MRDRLVRSIAISFIATLFAASASAQQATAEIRGRVVDQQEAALPGVTVVITNQDSGNFREAISGPDGTWFAPALSPGRYQISAQLQGFKRFIRQELLLAVGTQLAIDVKLEVGSLEETVTVSSQAPLIDVT